MEINVLKDEFSVCKVASCEGIDLDAPFVFTGSTDGEKSLVCPTSRVPGATLAREDGWLAFRIEGRLDFSLVGIGFASKRDRDPPSWLKTLSPESAVW